ncbi:MAG: T9SS type A sorting domain-containing protein [Chitinivibrionales bacterium]|nr:T9SS type A sorting domain-containing protein [Chitinivibrionales bacterium]
MCYYYIWVYINNPRGRRAAVNRNTPNIIGLLLIVPLALITVAVRAEQVDTSLVREDTVSREAAPEESSFDPVALEKALGDDDGVLFDDIALYAPAEVIHCGLGLVIRNADGSRVSVAIHDAKGRPVLRERYDAGKGVINVRTDMFPTGVYVYTVHMSDTVYTRPFIVTR